MPGLAQFDPYALLAPLERRRVAYILVGSFARVIRGAEELPDSLELVPSLRPDNLRRLQQALDDLAARPLAGQEPDLAQWFGQSGAAVETTSEAGRLTMTAAPEGTRGHDDLRRAATREHLGHGLQPSVASLPDLARMLAARNHESELPKLYALRRLRQLEHNLGPQLGR